MILCKYCIAPAAHRCTWSVPQGEIRVCEPHARMLLKMAAEMGAPLALIPLTDEDHHAKQGALMDDIGRIGYAAYAKSTGGKTYDGRDMPKWDDLGDRIKDAWRAAAGAVRDTLDPTDVG